MSTNLSELHFSSSSSSSLDPSDMIEHYADSDINELSQPQISDLDAEVSRLLDHHSSGSESDDESSSPSSPLHMVNKRQQSQKSHYEPISVGGDSDIGLPQPLVSDMNTEEGGSLDQHSIELDCNQPSSQRTSTTHEVQLKDQYRVVSVRGSGGIVTAPSVKESAEDPAVTGSIEGSGRMPHLALRENFHTGKYLSLLQFQPEGLKPSPAGSLLGTPSPSTCQLNGDSDECPPKSLSEELEEAAAAMKVVEDEPPSPNEGMLSTTDSEDYSDSKSYDSEEEIEFKLQEGDNEEELPSPLLTALTTATYQSSHGSESNVGETKDMKRTSEGVIQSSNGLTCNSTEVDKSSVPAPSVSNVADQFSPGREVLSTKPLVDEGHMAHIPNIQDEMMMPMSDDSHIQPALNVSRSIVDPQHSDGHMTVVSQSPKSQQNEDLATVKMHSKKIKRFLPPTSGGIEASEKAAAHSGTLMMSNAPTTQLYLESRNKIKPRKCKWDTGSERDNAPVSGELFESWLEDLTITDSEVGSISGAGEALSPVTASHEILPQSSTVRDGKSSSSQPLPGVSPSTSTIGVRRPLKGILKKSKYEKSSTAASTVTTATLPETNVSPGSSETDIFEKSSTQRIPLVSQQSTLYIETNVARGDDDKVNSPRGEDNFKLQHSTALSSSPITSGNHQHTADGSLQPTPHSHSSQLNIDNKTPQEGTDGLPTTSELAYPLQMNNDLVDQVKALEKRQLKMVSVFAMERAALWDIIMKQNQVMSSLCRKGRQDQAKLTNVKRHIKLLERKLEDLEAEIVQVGRIAVSQKRSSTPSNMSEVDTPELEPSHGMGSLVSRKKLAKLTKFFGDTPPILQQFLERLGYEEHIVTFKSAGIGLPELPHITADKLKELGIPLGHRIRILQEAQKLA